MARGWHPSTPRLFYHHHSLHCGTDRARGSGIPVVRAISKQPAPPAQTTFKPQLNPEITNPRTYVDSLCQSYGHKAICCDKVAQFLIIQESTKKINDKLKAKILENYQKLVQDFCSWFLYKVKTAVQQLCTEELSQAADEIRDQCHQMDDQQDDRGHVIHIIGEWWSGKVKHILSIKDKPPDAAPDPKPLRDVYQNALATITHAYHSKQLLSPNVNHSMHHNILPDTHGLPATPNPPKAADRQMLHTNNIITIQPPDDTLFIT